MISSKKGAVMFGLLILLALQILGTIFFVGELWSEILGLRTWALPWQAQEIVQIFASLALILGTAAGVGLIRHSQSELRKMNLQIEALSGQFHEHVRAHFARWALSTSEQAVAVYAMKGFSNPEIAALRGTTTATIKSQMNAVFRKTGLGSRQQLVAFLVEELLESMEVG